MTAGAARPGDVLLPVRYLAAQHLHRVGDDDGRVDEQRNDLVTRSRPEAPQPCRLSVAADPWMVAGPRGPALPSSKCAARSSRPVSSASCVKALVVMTTCAHRHNDQVRGRPLWLGVAPAEGTKSIRSARTCWKSWSANYIMHKEVGAVFVIAIGAVIAGL